MLHQRDDQVLGLAVYARSSTRPHHDGLVVALEYHPGLAVAGALVAFFAVFHGHAHGAELPDGQNGLLYSIGFVVATGTLHATGIGLGLMHKWESGRLALRVAGAGIGLAGAWFMWSGVTG